MAAQTLLSVGLNPDLLNIRNSILRKAGYSVQATTSPQKAITLLVDGDFGVLIVCHTILESDRGELLRAIKSVKPSAKVIAVRKDEELAKGADATVHNLDEPESLLACLAALLQPSLSFPTVTGFSTEPEEPRARPKIDDLQHQAGKKAA